LVSAGLTEHKCEILSINLLFSDLDIGKTVFNLRDLFFALWTGVLAVSHPLVYAFVTVDVAAGIQRCHFVLVHYFKTDCATLFVFFFAHAR
jgi:hypothetical protein